MDRSTEIDTGEPRWVPATVRLQPYESCGKVPGLGLRSGSATYRNQKFLFPVHQVAGIEGRQLKAVAVRDGIGGTGFHAVAAEDAAVVVDVIDLGVTLGAADAVLFRVLRCFDVNAVGRARCRAQKAG